MTWHTVGSQRGHRAKVYTRYARVLKADGEAMTGRDVVERVLEVMHVG